MKEKMFAHEAKTSNNRKCSLCKRKLPDSRVITLQQQAPLGCAEYYHIKCEDMYRRLEQNKIEKARYESQVLEQQLSIHTYEDDGAWEPDQDKYDREKLARRERDCLIYEQIDQLKIIYDRRSIMNARAARIADPYAVCTHDDYTGDLYPTNAFTDDVLLEELHTPEREGLRIEDVIAFLRVNPIPY